jgi:hypothetical protein
LLDTFTFADVAMVEVLMSVEPAPELRLGAASRRAFGDAALCAHYDELLGWRDELRRVYREREF